MKKRHLTLIAAGILFTLPVLADTGFLDFSDLFSSSVAPQSASVNEEAAILSQKAPTLSPDAIKLALTAYEKAKNEGYTHKPYLTVIDYSKPSSQPRLAVFDLAKNKLLFQTFVAHGKNSGDATSTRFSNDSHSLASSLGVFVTGETYEGKHGMSLRLNGLEPGFNDHARERGVVIHGADYVNAQVAQTYGKVGRSWGCPAVSSALVGPIIQAIKNGSVVFAYYPDKRWLHSSSFLHA